MHNLGLKTSIQNFDAFVRCMLMRYQPYFQNGIRERPVISNNITCPQTGIIFKVEEFLLPFWSDNVITAKISDTRPKRVRQKLNVLVVEKATHTKDTQTEKTTKMCQLQKATCCSL